MDTETPPWGPWKKIFFRFSFVYFVLYLFPAPLDALPYGGKIAAPIQALWNALVTWAGRGLFGVEITVLPNGSGDTTWNYVQVLCCAVLSLFATLVWTLLDRRRPRHDRLLQGLRIYLRFALAFTMISYGAIKVFKAQFPDPSLDRLLQPFGEASPMGLLWTFMGASKSYNVFTGLAELMGGLLLTLRRTTLLGALVSAAVMANVVMLNFSYDVPVKLFSSHLLAMAVFLILPDLSRLANFFLLDRPVAAAGERPVFRSPRLHHGTLALRTVATLAFVAMSLYGAWQATVAMAASSSRFALRGIWEVEAFECGGRERPPRATEADRWRRVIVSRPQMMAVQLMSDQRQRYLMDVNPIQRSVRLSKRDDPAWNATLTFEQPEPDHLVLAGELDGRNIRARLRRAQATRFLLLNRGFHWINEYPFNS